MHDLSTTMFSCLTAPQHENKRASASCLYTVSSYQLLEIHSQTRTTQIIAVSTLNGARAEHTHDGACPCLASDFLNVNKTIVSARKIVQHRTS